MSKNKRANKKFQPNTKKIPKYLQEPKIKAKPSFDKLNSPESSKMKKPVWRVGMIDFEGDWSWNKIDNISKLIEIQSKLKNFETMTWAEIENKLIKKGTPQNHFMPVENICKNAQLRLSKINLDDIDCLYSLRLSGLKRIWGIHDNEILNIIWWDPEHTVYPVKKL